jgi:hypothetical protein
LYLLSAERRTFQAVFRAKNGHLSHVSSEWIPPLGRWVLATLARGERFALAMGLVRLRYIKVCPEPCVMNILNGGLLEYRNQAAGADRIA